MRRLMPLLMFAIFLHANHARVNYNEHESRPDRVISVYDRNCFFSPIGCHFLHGRRAMTFVTPSEVEEKERRQLFNHHAKQPTRAMISPD